MASTTRPDVTKAQIIASLVAGVPTVSNLLAAFGVWHPNPHQQHALTATLIWAVAFGALLVAADAHLRAARNKADAAGATAPAQTPHTTTTLASVHVPDQRTDELDLSDPQFDDPGTHSAPGQVTAALPELESHGGGPAADDLAERDARTGTTATTEQVQA